jgi:hypothetical protein
MSLTAVRPYFRNILNTLGYEEWETSFNSQNIPETIQEKVYHIEVLPISSGPANQLTREFTFPVSIKLFLKDYDLNTDVIDDALLQCETILGEVLKVSNRLTQPGIKDVIPNQISLEPLNGADENSVIINLGFSIKLLCATA